MILVAGAGGNIGCELVSVLAGRGEQVRALTRPAPSRPAPSKPAPSKPAPAKPAPAGGDRPAFPPGVQQAAGDLNSPESMRAALAGVRGLFLLPGYQNMPATLNEARQAGVDQVVLVSSSSIQGGDPGNAVTRYMMESEAAVRESGLAWTFLRSFGFMSNTLQWVPQLQAGDIVRAPWADVPVAMIDPYDIAAVAAAAFTSAGHEGRVYTLSGPEPLRPADRVRILGKVLGRNLTFQGQPDDEARAEMSKSMPAEYVDAFFRFYSAGTLDESHVQPDVSDVTGRPPRSFRQWAQAHASMFSQPA